MSTIISKLHQAIERRNGRLIEKYNESNSGIEERTLFMHKKRGAEIVKATSKGEIIRVLAYGYVSIVDYYEENERLIKMKDTFYIEERQERRRAFFENGLLYEDTEVIPIVEEVRPMNREHISRNDKRGEYDRREAVRYAERWWNDYHPNYERFTDNCTNFISQCLYAGGAQMNGYPDSSNGWWYMNGNWSFSWSVAHSMRWYLSGAKKGLRGVERERAKDLERGDVICYDFDGDGRWQHTTIVVDFDANGEPLVNAQTANSRMRYWSYEDSTAWTPNIKYLFFHIVTS